MTLPETLQRLYERLRPSFKGKIQFERRWDSASRRTSLSDRGALLFGVLQVAGCNLAGAAKVKLHPFAAPTSPILAHFGLGRPGQKM